MTENLDEALEPYRTRVSGGRARSVAVLGNRANVFAALEKRIKVEMS